MGRFSGRKGQRGAYEPGSPGRRSAGECPTSPWGQGHGHRHFYSEFVNGGALGGWVVMAYDELEMHFVAN